MIKHQESNAVLRQHYNINLTQIIKSITFSSKLLRLTTLLYTPVYTQSLDSLIFFSFKVFSASHADPPVVGVSDIGQGLTSPGQTQCIPLEHLDIKELTSQKNVRYQKQYQCPLLEIAHSLSARISIPLNQRNTIITRLQLTVFPYCSHRQQKVEKKSMFTDVTVSY